MSLLNSTLCRLRPAFSPAIKQLRSSHNIYGPPRFRTNFGKMISPSNQLVKCVMGVGLMAIILGPSAFFLNSTRNTRAAKQAALAAEEED